MKCSINVDAQVHGSQPTISLLAHYSLQCQNMTKQNASVQGSLSPSLPYAIMVSRQNPMALNPWVHQSQSKLYQSQSKLYYPRREIRVVKVRTCTDK